MCVWVNLDFFSYESNYIAKKIAWFSSHNPMI
jgi:hypothetical protein